MKTISNLKDYLEFISAETPYQAGRNLYKYTDCGPWTSFVKEVKPAHTRHAKLAIVIGSNGRPRATDRKNVTLDDLGYLGFNSRGFALPEALRSLKSYREFNLKEIGGQGLTIKVVPKKSNRRKVQLSLTELVPSETESVYYGDSAANSFVENCAGIEIGSIVEGSDAEIGPYYLKFPFTDKEFEDTVKEINSEASSCWHEANDCDEDEE